VAGPLSSQPECREERPYGIRLGHRAHHAGRMPQKLGPAVRPERAAPLP